MREGFFIIFVVLLLLGLTALRYRKQIKGLIGVAKMLQEAKNAAPMTGMDRGQPSKVQLVNCAKCQVWVPEGKAVKRRDGQYYCSTCA